MTRQRAAAFNADGRCRCRLLSPKRAAEQCRAKLALVVLGSALSLYGRNFSHALALAVGVLKVDIHNPELPHRARDRVAAFLAPHTHLSLFECETRP